MGGARCTHTATIDCINMNLAFITYNFTSRPGLRTPSLGKSGNLVDMRSDCRHVLPLL